MNTISTVVQIKRTFFSYAFKNAHAKHLITQILQNEHLRVTKIIFYHNAANYLHSI